MGKRGMGRALAILSAAAAATIGGLTAPAFSLTLSDVVYQDQIVPIIGTQIPIVCCSTNGLQQWQGNLGMDFTVNSSITVGALGVFDNGSTRELAGTTGNGIEVGIFNLTTGQLVSPSVLFSPSSVVTQIAGDAFQNIAPLKLTAGSYSIVTLNDPNYNQGFFGGANIYQTLNDLGGAISFIGSGRFDSNSGVLELPGGVDGGPVNRYDAGTFAVTPLPATWAMMLIGLVGLAFVACRRHKLDTALTAA